MATDTTSKLLEIIEEASDFADEITPGMTFEELGLDSLDFISMINKIRDEVGPISDAEASRCGMVGDLVRHFCS